MRAAEFEARLRDLAPGEKDELAYLLVKRAKRERRRLTVDEAREAIRTADLSLAWRRSVLADVGRIRAAGKQLRLDGWLPEQFAAALAEAGLEVEKDGAIVANAISGGIKDAARLLT